MFLTSLGRYFGVVASWHWKDIVDTIKRHYPEYSVPPCNYEDEDMKVSFAILTQFSCQNTQLYNNIQTCVRSLETFLDNF